MTSIPRSLGRYILLALVALALAACGAAASGQTPAAPQATRAAPASTTAAPTSRPIEAPTSAPTAAKANDCATIEHLAIDSPEAQAIARAFIRSLPAGHGVGQIEQLYGVDRLGAWVVLEASFTESEPGVSVLRLEGTGYREIASWGGPVLHAHQLQDYLSAQVPDAPPALLTCLKPKQAHFNH